MVERCAARSAEVQAAGPNRRALLLDCLLLDASRDARQLREESALRIRLREAAAEVGALGTEPARALAAQNDAALTQDAAHEASVQVLTRDAPGLLSEAATVIAQETAAITAAARRRAVLGAFATFGTMNGSASAPAAQPARDGKSNRQNELTAR